MSKKNSKVIHIVTKNMDSLIKYKNEATIHVYSSILSIT